MQRTSVRRLAPVLAFLAVAFGSALRAAPEGAWILDSSRSTLTATAIKNGEKAVPVDFPGLLGWADLGSGTAELQIPLKTLSTGNLARDYNIRTFFFEVDTLATYSVARFNLNKVDADLSKLRDGESVQGKGYGSLSLHGGKLALEGPLTLTKAGNSIKVVLGKGWAVPIDKTTLTKALLNMSTHCPQPHHVGNVVKLSGELVFVP